jgi:hypothetical protein
MVVDLRQIKTVEDLEGLSRLEQESLFDESPEYGEVYDFQLTPNLTAEEVEDALFWARFMRGIMLVDGPAGSGKGMVSNMISWKMKRYFNKKVLLDYKPRRAFGVYHPFNTQVLVEQLGRMSSLAKGDEVQANIAFQNPLMKDLTHEWMTSKGQVFLKNSVLVLDEVKRYMDKRRPFNPMGLVLDDIFDIWRHLDILIIGATIDKNKLDQKRFIPAMTTEIRCTWLTPYTVQRHGLSEYSALYTIYPLRYVGAAGEGVLEVAGRPINRVIEGGKPRECLDGKRWVDIYNTKDAKAISVPKSLRKMAKD